MEYGETHCEPDRKYLYCLLFFILSKRTQWNFLKTKLLTILQSTISLRRVSFQKRLSSDIETDHLQASFPKDLEHVLFFSLLLSLNSFNPHYINADWKGRFNAAVIKAIF